MPMNDALKYSVLVALALPLAVYVWAAMSTPRSKVSTLAGYFTAYKQVESAPFANSSLAYAFQIATLFPFLYWGIAGQILPALVNAIFWGIGIFLFRAAINSIMQRLDEQDDPKTLHGLLGETYASTLVQKVAAGVTILGMLGMALGESYWGMQIVKVLVPEDTPAYYAIVIGALFFVLVYIWYGGAWGSLKTDMLQLVFSYLGFTVVFSFAALAIMHANAIQRPELPIVSLLMFIGGIWAVVTRLRQGIQPVSPMSSDENDQKWFRLGKILSFFTLLSMVVLAVFFAILFLRSLPSLTLAPLANPGDPKWTGVVALAMMAMMFQFVDMTAWQRIQAIRGTKSQVRDRARCGLYLFSVESPYTWILCLALGTLLVTTMPQLASVQDKAGALAAFPRILLESGEKVNYLIAFAFMVAVMGVMLSTIDAALLGAMYAWVSDFIGAKFKKPSIDFAELSPNDVDIKQEQAALYSGKKAAFWVLVLIIALVILLGGLLKRPQDFISVLIGFYGAMLSLFPAVMFMLFAPKEGATPSGMVVTIGIVAGTCGAISFTVWGIFDPDKAWYGVFAGPMISFATSLLLHSLGLRDQS